MILNFTAAFHLHGVSFVLEADQRVLDMYPQNKAVLSHLQQHGFITQDIAVECLGIRRLGARIYELRAEGHEIATHIITVPNRYGTTSKIARYILRSV